MGELGLVPGKENRGLPRGFPGLLVGSSASDLVAGKVKFLSGSDLES